MNFPISPYNTVHGMYYFARMLDKIRLIAHDLLDQDYVGNLGGGMDARCCGFLRIEYSALREKALEEDDDEKVFQWCLENGRNVSEVEIEIWNGFISKRGWRDEATAFLDAQKAQSDLSHRDDLVTLFEFFEVDEGRKP